MSNFEYIISSLPYLTADFKYQEGQGFKSTVDQIRENISENDTEVMDFVLSGYDADVLGPDFYAQALSHPLKFVREFFRFDLNLRNAKVRYLNRALGRPDNQDLITGEGTEEDQDLDIDGYRFSGGEFEELQKVEDALASTSLLGREKALDDISWEKITQLETFHYFDLTAVLAYIAKLHIVNRWLALDQEKGRKLLRQLVNEVRGTFKGGNYTE